MRYMIVEKKKFKNIWIWLIVIILNCFVIFGIVKQIFFNIPFGENPAPNFILILGLLSTFSLFLMLIFVYLKIIIDDDSITIIFFPFIKKNILFDEIKKIEIIKYSPLKDYGGWGIRYGNKGVAYSIGGNLGLSITLLSNKNILIGINNKNKYKSLNLKTDEIINE